MRKNLSPLVLLVALLLTACDFNSRMLPPKSAANEFFLEIGESRFQEAYESTAFSFQAQTNFRSFQATARDLGLSAKTVSCNWESEEHLDRDAKLVGQVVKADGSSVPVTLTLIQERGAWRVFTLRTPGQSGNKEEDRFSLLGKGNGFNSSANHELPAMPVLEDLILKSLLLFNSAAKQRNFTEFSSKVSLAWQNQLTVTQLKNAFQPFIDTNADLSGIKDLHPIFEIPPSINSDGILTLTGHYNTKPYLTNFTLRFIFEFPYWKLYAIQVKIQS